DTSLVASLVNLATDATLANILEVYILPRGGAINAGELVFRAQTVNVPRIEWTSRDQINIAYTRWSITHIDKRRTTCRVRDLNGGSRLIRVEYRETRE